MTKAKKRELMASAPWRVNEESNDEFKNAKLKVTSKPGGTSTMHVPGKKSPRSKDQDPDDSLTEIDPELRYSFQRNFQVLFLYLSSNLGVFVFVATIPINTYVQCLIENPAHKFS